MAQRLALSYLKSSMFMSVIYHFRACGSYQYFLDIGLLQTGKLLNQGFLMIQCISPP